MRGYRKLLGSIGVATLLVGVTSVALASGPASFKTGTYKGKTSQG